MEALGLKDGDMGQKKTDVLRHLVLVAGAVGVPWANWFFVMPS